MPSSSATGSGGGGSGAVATGGIGAGSGSSGDSSTDGSGGGNALTSTRNCTLGIQLTTDHASYSGGSDPRFTVTVSDVGSGTCTIDVGRRGLALTIRTGDTRVWSSGDCPAQITPDDRQLSPGDSYQETIVWTRTHSTSGCAPDQPGAALGSYTAAASVAGVTSDKVAFELSYSRRRRDRPAVRSAGRRGRGSDVPFEDRGLGEPRQALAHAAGARLADALDGLEVADAGGEQLLQAAEVLDEAVDDRAGQPRDLARSR